LAVWAKRSIENLGFERDFYVHIADGAPVSVETTINRQIETPISASDTWKKITSGRSDALDRSDKAILYALVRNLHARTPHALETARELVAMASSPSSTIPFTAEEREFYADLQTAPGGPKALINSMASSFDWATNDFHGCWMAVMRSPVPLRSSTTPVLSVRAPAHSGLRLPLPGMTPYMLVLTVDPHTLVALAIGDFDGAFENIELDVAAATYLNKQYVGQFAYFPAMRHLICGRAGVVEDMTWAPYDFVEADERRVVFRRRSGS
jgi:hypothetical protein